MATKKVQDSGWEKWNQALLWRGREEGAKQKRKQQKSWLQGHQRRSRRLKTQIHRLVGMAQNRGAPVSFAQNSTNIIHVVQMYLPSTEHPIYKSQEMARLREKEEHAYKDIQGSDISHYPNQHKHGKTYQQTWGHGMTWYICRRDSSKMDEG